MHIIGIVGTAKNTGKTTTLAALIVEAGRRGGRIGVTGIGYDGEEIDTITGLPKPRLMLQAGTIVATSEQCLPATSAGYSVIEQTDARTALGAVVIVEILTPGLMVLAGPNTKRLLANVIGEMEAMRLEAIFVDGSLNRIAAMSVVDTMVFTTGASHSTEIAFLSEEAHAIRGMFIGAGCAVDASPECITLTDASGAASGTLPMRSLFDADDARRLLASLTDAASRIVIPNMVTLEALDCLAQHAAVLSAKDRTIVLADPTIALLAGEPRSTLRAMRALSARGFTIEYRHSITVGAMTVNPFFPSQRDHVFVPAYIDADTLLRTVSGAVDVPVYNIRDDGAASALYKQLMP